MHAKEVGTDVTYVRRDLSVRSLSGGCQEGWDLNHNSTMCGIRFGLIRRGVNYGLRFEIEF